MARTDDVERRLRRIEDEVEIVRLKSRYFNAGDAQDFDTLGDCFTEDAVINYPPFQVFHGGAELRDTFRRAAGEMPAINVHHGHNPDIRFLDADTAEGTWNLYFFAYFPRTATVHHSSGFYQDRYVRTATGWKMSQSRTEMRLAFDAAIVAGDGLKVWLPSFE